jgi:hypothetical protein
VGRTLILLLLLTLGACDLRSGDGDGLNYLKGLSFTFDKGEQFDAAAFHASVERLELWRSELVESGFEERPGALRSWRSPASPAGGRIGSETVLAGRLDGLGRVMIILSHQLQPDTTSFTFVRLRARVRNDTERAEFERLRAVASRVITGRSWHGDPPEQQLRLRERR